MPLAILIWPDDQCYTRSALQRAFARVLPRVQLTSSGSAVASQIGLRSVQFSDYDAINWDVPTTSLVSSYAIRKALIRKHHLPLTAAQHIAKHPTSLLATAVPTTFPFELAYADELDELWADELYDLQVQLDAHHGWWILKPGMADRGQGIRLFSSRQQLESIFADFESAESDEGESGTAVALSHMRWWIVQRYIEQPLLIDNRKFHVRAYVLAVGALQVYLYTDLLALFAPSIYCPLGGADPDPSAHLTNTCLHDPATLRSDSVRQFSALSIAPLHRKAAIDRIAQVVGEMWQAALGAGAHFQPLPNAFEIYGVDFLLDESHQPHLLEVNAGPDYKQTGEELVSVVETLFEATLRTAVAPRLLDEALPEWPVGDERWSLRKCLDVNVRAWK